MAQTRLPVSLREEREDAGGGASGADKNGAPRALRPGQRKIQPAVDNESLKVAVDVEIGHAVNPPAPRRRALQGKYALEIFAGSGNLSQAFAGAGLRCRLIDIQRGVSHDMKNPRLVQSILRDMRRGRVVLLWFGMPCETFSAAVFPAYRIRNYGIHVHRLPDLRDDQRARLDDANQLLRIMIRLCRAARELKIPFYI